MIPLNAGIACQITTCNGKIPLPMAITQKVKAESLKYR